ncbi:MAG: hypothetical protein ABIP48_11800 [Planctomycetota bacterium]
MENPKALRNITPEIPYVPTNDPNWQPGDQLFYWSYRDPYPIDRDLFLVAYGGPAGGPERYRLYLLDENGEKILLLEDENISCFNPVPLAPRRHPHQVAAHAATGEEFGTFLLADVYRGLTGVERGEVKELRVMSQVRKPTNNRGARAYFNGHDIVDPVIGAGTFYVKVNLGTVPVEADGSAHFRAPAGTELYFQALDADGQELSRMGSFTQLVPGEHQGCIGCHEPRFQTPPHARSVPLAAGKGPVEITPPEYSRVLNAPLAKAAGGLELCADKDGQAPARFADKTDPDYLAMLEAITEGKTELYSRPRIDMPGATPAPYDQDFGHLFRGGGR